VAYALWVRVKAPQAVQPWRSLHTCVLSQECRDTAFGCGLFRTRGLEANKGAFSLWVRVKAPQAVVALALAIHVSLANRDTRVWHGATENGP
jgi:hypothetical protein